MVDGSESVEATKRAARVIYAGPHGMGLVLEETVTLHIAPTMHGSVINITYKDDYVGTRSLCFKGISEMHQLTDSEVSVRLSVPRPAHMSHTERSGVSLLSVNVFIFFLRCFFQCMCLDLLFFML